MFRRIVLAFSVRAYRDVQAVPGRPGYWRLTGSRPEFELQIAEDVFTENWAAIDFPLSMVGGAPGHYLLTVQTPTDKQQLYLSGHYPRAVIRLHKNVRSVRLLLLGATGQVFIGPVAVRLLHKAEAGIKLLARVIVGRRVGWRQVVADAKDALDVLKSDGVFGLLTWLIKINLHAQMLDVLPSPVAADLDLWNDVDAAQASCLERTEFLWPPQQLDTVDDLWAAARFCVDLLRSRADLRERFPRALSERGSGAFANWLRIEGPDLFQMKPEACEAIRDVFAADLAGQVRQIYLTRESLRTQIPFALTPVGRREFFHWLQREGRIIGIRLETIWWFLLESAEQPSTELVRTYLFSPEWQNRIPDGTTVFGRVALAEWLTNAYRLDGHWLRPETWPMVGTPAQQLRLAYSARPNWQERHPTPFNSLQTAQLFLCWLATAESGLTADVRAWCASLNKHAVASELVTGGINVLGQFCFPSGLRTSVEMLSEGMRQIGVGLSLRDIWTDEWDDPCHAQFDGLEYYDVTLIHTQPEPFFDASYVRSGLRPRDRRTYRIAYWYWELDDIPESWTRCAMQVDELWVATKFVADGVRRQLDVPVHRIMPGIKLPSFSPRPRSYFNIPEGKFVFLFVFHMMSVMERKNPFGLIDAYRRAFDDSNDTLLIIKTTFGSNHPDSMAQLHAAAAGANIAIIDAIYSREETLALMEVADCYVSLHRSEGWGLTMAEAMLLGKPVIATGYSGNMDFMDNANSLLVDYEMAALERAYPPYAIGGHWANPSVDHAARFMRQVFKNQRWARELGERAKCDLQERMSPSASGVRIATRLAEIKVEQARRQNTGIRKSGSCLCQVFRHPNS